MGKIQEEREGKRLRGPPPKHRPLSNQIHRLKGLDGEERPDWQDRSQWRCRSNCYTAARAGDRDEILLRRTLPFQEGFCQASLKLRHIADAPNKEQCGDMVVKTLLILRCPFPLPSDNKDFCFTP